MMNVGFNGMMFRPATILDSLPIVDIIRSSFPPFRLGATVYGCFGVHKYVESLIDSATEITDTLFFVAEEAGRVVGVAEFRILPKSIFLNYVCVDSEFRHRGVARRLFQTGLESLPAICEGKIYLDVFTDNTNAIEWYLGMGFTAEYTSVWRSIENTERDPLNYARVVGLPSAETCFIKFGFSQFGLTSGSATYVIGKLGPLWFRVSDEAILSDEQALATLWHLDCKRKILGIFRTPPEPVFEADGVFSRSTRMSCSLSSIKFL